MKKKAAGKQLVASPKAKSGDLASLIAEVRALIQSARRGVASVVDTFQVMTNFEIGRRIVDHEQKGARRAAYGAELLKELSARLTEEFGKGFSARNLRSFRSFFLTYAVRLPKIWQQPAAKLISRGIWQQPAAKLGGRATSQESSGKLPSFEIGQEPTDQFKPQIQAADSPPGFVSQTASGKANAIEIRQTLSDESGRPFTLSWTHYVVLLTIKDPDERSFYEIEATNEGWSVPELRRQKASALYQRLALSRDKAGIKRLASEGQIVSKPEDLFKEPYVLEFLGLDEKAGYSETDLESAIISHLERFLLELGKGFLFEARQRRFTFDEDHFFVDLVFYNRLLRCYVLIDLKLDKLTHQDLGQMQKYVNYFDRHVRLPDEGSTIGVLLCRQKKSAVVELTLPKDANIHAREYELYLPSKELLKAKLLEWTRAAEARA